MTPVALAAGRVEPYLRALSAGLDALAPRDEFVPPAAARAHLDALRPSLGDDVLAPCTYDAHSGMPTFDWMERAIGEAAVAREDRSNTPSARAVERARELDPELGARMGGRRALHAHLRRATLLPSSRVHAQLLRAGATADFRVTYDRLLADGRWLRVRLELEGPAGWEKSGPLRPRRDVTVAVDPGFRHLLSRHVPTPLGALLEQIETSLSVSVARLGRGIVGPFWFPGVVLPEGVPAELGRGLLLHQSLEVVARDVRARAHRDPLVSPGSERIGGGRHVFRERRFAASPGVEGAVHAWAEAAGVEVVVRRLL